MSTIKTYSKKKHFQVVTKENSKQDSSASRFEALLQEEQKMQLLECEMTKLEIEKQEPSLEKLEQVKPKITESSKTNKNENNILDKSKDELIDKNKISTEKQGNIESNDFQELSNGEYSNKKFPDFPTYLSDKFKSFIKIGEATFSEVYKADSSTVIKVIPIKNLSNESLSNERKLKRRSGIKGDELPVMDPLKAMNELRITSKIRSIKSQGIVEIQDVLLVQGKYPKDLLKAWTEYQTLYPEKAINPKPKYSQNQVFALILMKDGGTDLESFAKEMSIDQAEIILKKIATSLAYLENNFNFEHRDLHWGNVLIDQQLNIFIIDFTLSRLEINNQIFYTDLGSEEWLFEGDPKVDIQFQVYKDMRKIMLTLCKDNDNEIWKAFNPKTNVLWLDYLLRKFIELKLERSANLKKISKNILKYSSVQELTEKEPFFISNKS